MDMKTKKIRLKNVLAITQQGSLEPVSITGHCPFTPKQREATRAQGRYFAKLLELNT
jgi:hypothetical protein